MEETLIVISEKDKQKFWIVKKPDVGYPHSDKFEFHPTDERLPRAWCFAREGDIPRGRDELCPEVIASLNGSPPLTFSTTTSEENDIAILNFALVLEYLEQEFYNINVPASSPANPGGPHRRVAGRPTSLPHPEAGVVLDGPTSASFNGRDCPWQDRSGPSTACGDPRPRDPVDLPRLARLPRVRPARTARDFRDGPAGGSPGLPRAGTADAGAIGQPQPFPTADARIRDPGRDAPGAARPLPGRFARQAGPPVLPSRVRTRGKSLRT